MGLCEIDFGVEIGTVRRTRKRVVSRPSSRWWAAKSSTSGGGHGKVTRRSGAADRRPGTPPALEAESSTEAGPQTRPPAFGEDADTQTEGETTP